MKYFSINELLRSDKAIEYNIDNTPTPEIKAHLSVLISRLLDPLREAWGGPITVNSGYRSPMLNKAVGGVPTSHHVSGYAADITVGSIAKNKELWKLLVASKQFKFTEAILEKGGVWIHVSYIPSNLECEVSYA